MAECPTVRVDLTRFVDVEWPDQQFKMDEWLLVGQAIEENKATGSPDRRRGHGQHTQVDVGTVDDLFKASELLVMFGSGAERPAQDRFWDDEVEALALVVEDALALQPREHAFGQVGRGTVRACREDAPGIRGGLQQSRDNRGLVHTDATGLGLDIG